MPYGISPAAPDQQPLMLALATPASLADCLAVAAPDGLCHRAVWLYLRYQVTVAPSYAMRDEQGRALALCGFVPWSDAVEIWLALAPDAGRRIGELIRMARLTLYDQDHSDARPFTAVVRTAEGRRIARLLGFEPRQSDQLFVRERAAH